MSYSAPQIVAAFLDANTVAGWGARSYTTDSLEQVHFNSPSRLVNIKYDCKQQAFVIGFEKVLAGWGEYVRAIARATHYILKTLQAGGLDFLAPDSADSVVIEVQAMPQGGSLVRVKAI